MACRGTCYWRRVRIDHRGGFVDRRITRPGRSSYLAPVEIRRGASLPGTKCTSVARIGSPSAASVAAGDRSQRLPSVSVSVPPLSLLLPGVAPIVLSRIVRRPARAGSNVRRPRPFSIARQRALLHVEDGPNWGIPMTACSFRRQANVISPRADRGPVPPSDRAVLTSATDLNGSCGPDSRADPPDVRGVEAHRDIIPGAIISIRSYH